MPTPVESLLTIFPAMVISSVSIPSPTVIVREHSSPMGSSPINGKKQPERLRFVIAPAWQVST
jgi:hypothetical protein